MKRILYAIIIIAMQLYFTPAIAQNSVENINSKLTAELSELKQEKLAIEVKSKEQEAACYKKFAVSNCLKDVKTEKLAALNGVKQRELAIGEQQRLQKEKAVMLKKGKTDTANQSKDASAATKDENVDKSGIKRKADKVFREPNQRIERQPAQDQGRINAAKNRVADTQEKLVAAKKKAQLRAAKQAQASEQAASYAKKNLLAEEHKNELAKQKAAKTKNKSAPLPIPTASEIAR